MLSVIHPSSTQQHPFGGSAATAFRGYQSNEAGAPFVGFMPVSSSSNVMNNNRGFEGSKWTAVPTATAAVATASNHMNQCTSVSSNSCQTWTNSLAYSGRHPYSSSDILYSSSKYYDGSYRSRSSSSQNPSSAALQAKDYSKPLFVDCSIEYELPNAPKIPQNSQPILMIHPAYKQKRASHHSAASSSSNHSSNPSSSSSTKSKSKGLKRTISQATSDQQQHHHHQLQSNQVALLQEAQQRHHLQIQRQQQHHQQQQFNGQQNYGPPSAKRPCIPQDDQVKQSIELRRRQQEQQQQQQQVQAHHHYYWAQQASMNRSRTYSAPDYWGCQSSALAYYKAQLRLRQQESLFKSMASYCLNCAQGKCSQVNWNKENLCLLRSL
eukprot:TRINITY_DN351_c0_g1_i1.p1 TRINITY_DN351_c0_g1~~TRINITY_DN351_c0_g1_i1.p1  ORF type:complete len:380 (-),score=139.06 TRINITY_DN351_c0_g1_i1:1095-2234(-)